MTRNRLTRLLVVAALVGSPLAARASDGGFGGGGVPNARGPVYDPNKEFHAGVAALGDGKYHVAKQDFEHVLAMVPDQPAALSMLGQSEQGLGDLRGAARAFEDSLRADPKQIVPARDLAIVDEKLGRHDKAVIQFQALKQRADACGDACAEAGDLTGAVRDVEAVLGQDSQARAASPKTPAS